jgi:signal transduction histidine kinase
VTSTERHPTWSERLNPRNWNLAIKLIAVGLVPTLLALVLGVLRIADQAGVAQDLGTGNRLLEIRQQLAVSADALRAERDAAVLFVAGNRQGDRAALESADAATDAELDKARQALADPAAQSPGTTTAMQQAEGGFTQLPVLRTAAVSSPVPAEDVLNQYTDIIQRADVLESALLRQAQTEQNGGLADALAATTAASEALALQHTVIGGAIAAAQLREPDRTAATGSDAAYRAAFAAYQVSLTPEQLGRYGNFATDGANVAREQLRTAVLGTPAGRPVVADPVAWNAAYQQSAQVVENAAAGVENELTGNSAAAQEEASNQAGVNSVILMLGLLLGIAIIVLLARSLIRSLRVLQRSALDVAERRLPAAVENMRTGNAINAIVEPVPLSGRDEVGQVARAFDAVHGQAVRLAADQAALQANVSNMFVNLSRRSQALVERQLQLIEQLESNEQDPDQLSNLFQLDHLATRMRRNSENLLVLAGTDFAKRNIAPVPVVDVLRAAVSEIEQYQRIVVQPPPTATVAGRAASDIVHLLAELLDNATNFSPPDSQVVMSTVRLDDGSLLIEIADRGVGMADAELSEANQRLDGPSAVDVSASRRMGLFVVGRLSHRHGLAIRLGSTPIDGGGGGLTASVTVPSALVPSAEAGPAQRAVAPAPQVPQQTPSTPERPASGLQRANGRNIDPEGSPNGSGQNGSRSQVNGTPRTGSLSSLVAGSDGPMSPAGAFEQAFRPDAPKAPSSLNGSNGLPTRKPGSALRRNEPPESASPSPFDAFERPDPAERPSAAERLTAFDKTRRDSRPDELADTPDAPGEATFGGIAAAGAAGLAAGLSGRGRDASQDRSDDARDETSGNGAETGAAEGDLPDGSRTSAGPDDIEDTDDTATRANPIVAESGPEVTAAAEHGTDADRREGRLESLGGPWAVESLRDTPDDLRDAGAPGSGSNGSAPESRDGIAPGASSPNGSGSDGSAFASLPKREPGALSRGVPRSDDLVETGETEDGTAPGTTASATAAASGGREDTAEKDRTTEDLPDGETADEAPDPLAEDVRAGGHDSGDTGDDENPDGGAQDERSQDSPTPDFPGTGVSGSGRNGAVVGPLPTRNAPAAGPAGPGSGRPGFGGPGSGRPDTPGNGVPGSGPFRPAEQPVGASAFAGPRDRPGEEREQDVLPVRGGRTRNDQGRNGLDRNGPGQNLPGQNGPGQGQNGPGGQGQVGQGQGAPNGGGLIGPGGLPRRRPQAPMAAQAPSESLFAPNVAGAGTPANQLRRPGGFEAPRNAPPAGAPGAPFGAAPSGPTAGGPAGLTGPASTTQAGFDMGQTTPIFEEIASAWFRSNRAVPVRWEDGQEPDAARGQGPQAFQPGSQQGGRGRGPEGPVRTGGPAQFGRPAEGGPAGLPRRTPGSGDRQPLEAPVGVRAEAGRGPALPERTGPQRDEEFATAADEGWRAAESTVAEAERSAEVTTAGLPKRRPRARLVPGSAAGSAVLAGPSAPSRSAEVIRGRLTSYQQGVRQGRESRLRRQAGPPPAGGPARTTEQQEES